MLPIETHGGHLCKRGDLYQVAGCNGGKAQVIEAAVQGAAGVVTAGPRASSQIYIAARICHQYGIPFRCHLPRGPATPEMEDVVAHGGEILQHKAGYNNVLQARAAADHKQRPGWALVPLWLRGMQTVDVIRQEVANVATAGPVARIVAAAGSGMTVAAILAGLADIGADIPVLGVQVGADPRRAISTYGPFGGGRYSLVQPPTDYRRPAYGAKLGALPLDPKYEAKCLPHLRPGDLLWVAGYSIHHSQPKGVQ